MKKTKFLHIGGGKRIASEQSQLFHCEVWQNKQFRWLTFSTDRIQSAIQRDDPYALALNYLPAMVIPLEFLPHPNSACVLGLGGGSIVRYLYKHHPTTKTTAVEIDSSVINIAQKFFYLPEENQYFRIVNDNAINFIQNDSNKYDLLFVDIYGNDILPAQLLMTDFYQDSQSRLSENGIFAMNLITESKQQLISLISKVRKVFDNKTICIFIKGFANLVLLGFNNPNYSKKVADIAKHNNYRATLDSKLGLLLQPE